MKVPERSPEDPLYQAFAEARNEQKSPKENQHLSASWTSRKSVISLALRVAELEMELADVKAQGLADGGKSGYQPKERRSRQDGNPPIVRACDIVTESSLTAKERDERLRREVWREAAKLVDGYEHADHGFKDPPSDCDYCRELDEIQKDMEAKAQAEGGKEADK